jgi:hypothetical protein
MKDPLALTNKRLLLLPFGLSALLCLSTACNVCNASAFFILHFQLVRLKMQIYSVRNGSCRQAASEAAAAVGRMREKKAS